MKTLLFLTIFVLIFYTVSAAENLNTNVKLPENSRKEKCLTITNIVFRKLNIYLFILSFQYFHYFRSLISRTMPVGVKMMAETERVLPARSVTIKVVRRAETALLGNFSISMYTDPSLFTIIGKWMVCVNSDSVNS